MKKLVRTLDICSIPYKIYVATKDDEAALDSADAVCDVEKCYIKIRDDVPKAKLNDTLLHEIMHAVIEGSGAGELLDTKTEEHLIRIIVPHLRSVLRQIPKVCK